MRSIAKACRKARIGPTSRNIIFLMEADEDQSHDDIRDALRDALKEEIPTTPGNYFWVVEVWDAEFVYEHETPTETKIYSRPYTIDAEGVASLDNPVEVERETTFVPVGESGRNGKSRESAGTPHIGQIIPLIEVSVQADGTLPIKIVEPGWGSSAYYGADVLERDGPNVFCAGTQMFWDHQTDMEEAERPENELNNLAAVLETAARWVPNHPDGPGLYADAKVFGPFDKKLEDLAPHIGVSLNTNGFAEAGEKEGREGFILTELLKDNFTSIDFVTKAGAGGEIVALFESARPHSKEKAPMPEDQKLQEAQDKLTAAEDKVKDFEAKEAEREEEKIDYARLKEAALVDKASKAVAEALKDTDLHEVCKTRLVETLSENPPLKDGELDVEALKVKITEAAAEEATYIEGLTGAGGIRGMGGSIDSEDDAGAKKLEESVRARHPDFSDAQVHDYVYRR